MKLQIFQVENKQWYFRIKAKNGRIIAQSEGYHKKQTCLKTAKLFNIPIYEL